MATKLSAIVLWAIACGVGFPLLIVLIWLLSWGEDISAAGIVVIALAAVGLVFTAVALLRFVVRQ